VSIFDFSICCVRNLRPPILNNTASTVAGTAIMGGDVTWGTVVGGVAGGLVGSGIPQFSGVKGGALANIGAEIGYNAVRGGITGSVTGGVSALVDGRDVGQGIERGFVNGAIGGAALAGVNIAALGPAYIPERTYGDFGRYKPVYRRGTFITNTFFKGGGVTNQLKKPIGYVEDVNDFNNYLRAHETGHYAQEIQMGFGRFYYQTLKEYLRFGAAFTYGTPGTLEYGANQYSLGQVGYYYNIYGQRLIR
jgi:hypothetical protein